MDGIVIDAETAALLESGASLIVATVDAEAMPCADRAHGVLVVDGGARLRVTVARDSTRLLANLAATRREALTATEVAVFTSVQAKGAAAAIEAETADDRARRVRYLEAFHAAVREVDNATDDELARMTPNDFVVFEMTVVELYDQTPGPTAGRKLAPA